MPIVITSYWPPLLAMSLVTLVRRVLLQRDPVHLDVGMQLVEFGGQALHPDHVAVVHRGDGDLGRVGHGGERKGGCRPKRSVTCRIVPPRARSWVTRCSCGRLSPESCALSTQNEHLPWCWAKDGLWSGEASVGGRLPTGVSHGRGAPPPCFVGDEPVDQPAADRRGGRLQLRGPAIAITVARLRSGIGALAVRSFEQPGQQRALRNRRSSRRSRRRRPRAAAAELAPLRKPSRNSGARSSISPTPTKVTSAGRPARAMVRIIARPCMRLPLGPRADEDR